MYQEFRSDIEKFNQMFKVENFKKPTVLGCDRLINFKRIFLEEVKEYEKIEDMFKMGHSEIEILTELSDWLGDLIVYVASEAKRWGLPLDEILKIIMESNFSKLGEDGKPIIDDRGKILKGLNYWKPEGKIQELLERELKK